MIGALSGYAPYSNYYTQPYSGSSARVQSGQQAQQAGQVQRGQSGATVSFGRRAAQPGVPVQPVNPVTPVSADAGNPAVISLRQGADPVEMAVRMRIQYVDDPNSLRQAGQEVAAAGNGEPTGAIGVQKAAEEGKCQTCEERKYQDGSDDAGVSYQTPTHIDPEQAPAAVRGHEQEHVVREQAKAGRENRRVVSQTVNLHTDICPECGRVYVSGGTTRTTTAAQKPDQPEQKQDNARPAAFSVMA